MVVYYEKLSGEAFYLKKDYTWTENREEGWKTYQIVAEFAKDMICVGNSKIDIYAEEIWNGAGNEL